MLLNFRAALKFFIRLLPYFIFIIYVLTGRPILSETKKEEHDWNNYFKKTANKLGAPSAVKAAVLKKEANSERKKVWDLGAGTGAAALDLAAYADVTATDQSPKALSIIEKRAAAVNRNIKLILHDVANGLLPSKDRFDIVTAENVFPFVKPHAPDTMQDIIEDHIGPSMKPSACLYGTFFGPKHSWCSKENVRCYSLQAVKKMLENFKTCHITERIKRTSTPTQKDVNWDEIRFVACELKQKKYAHDSAHPKTNNHSSFFPKQWRNGSEQY